MVEIEKLCLMQIKLIAILFCLDVIVYSKTFPNSPSTSPP